MSEKVLLTYALLLSRQRAHQPPCNLNAVALEDHSAAQFVVFGPSVSDENPDTLPTVTDLKKKVSA